MEKLIKNALGQWQLIENMFRKSPEDTSKPIQQAPNLNKEENNKQLTKLFSEQNDHAINGRVKEAHETKGKIRNLVLTAPKGAIDIGHLGGLRDRQIKLKHPNGYSKVQAFNEQDMEEALNHHLGDARSIKDIHDNHGGIKTVEAALRTIGAKADPTVYSSLKFKNPNLHLDLIDLLNPSKSSYERLNSPDARTKGILRKGTYEATQSDPNLHAEVDRTWKEMQDGDNDNNDVAQGAHENAVINRALERFKRHHKIS